MGLNNIQSRNGIAVCTYICLNVCIYEHMYLCFRLCTCDTSTPSATLTVSWSNNFTLLCPPPFFFRVLYLCFAGAGREWWPTIRVSLSGLTFQFSTQSRTDSALHLKIDIVVFVIVRCTTSKLGLGTLTAEPRWTCTECFCEEKRHLICPWSIPLNEEIYNLLYDISVWTQDFYENPLFHVRNTIKGF